MRYDNFAICIVKFQTLMTVVIVYPQINKITHEHPDIDKDKMIDESHLWLIKVYHLVLFIILFVGID